MKQIKFLAKLTPGERLEQAFRLSDFVRRLALMNIRDEKRLNRKQAVRELRRRLYG